MNGNAPTIPSVRPIRRWLPRFSLKTLLILVGIFGAAFGYLGNILHRRNHQRHIVAQIQAAGGDVDYNWQFGLGNDLDFAGEVFRTSSKELLDGRTQRTRVTSLGTIEDVETPPGPKLLRFFLGNDVFAHVESVHFPVSRQAIREFDPRQFLELPQLKVVQLDGAQATDEWLRSLARVRNLRILNLSTSADCTATASGLAHLRDAKEFRSLGIFGECFTDEMAVGLGELRNLESLSLSFTHDLTAKGTAKFGNLKNLQELFIYHAKGLDDLALECLSEFHDLQILSLMDTNISDATLKRIAGLKKLEKAFLSYNKVGDEGIKSLVDLPNLKILLLNDTQVGDAGLESISKLPQLRNLNLGKTEITDLGLATIAKMTQLENLDLWRSNLTDNGIQQLQTLTNLKDLSIGPGISKAAADKLRAALPNCKIRRVDRSGSSSNPDVEDAPETSPQ